MPSASKDQIKQSMNAINDAIRHTRLVKADVVKAKDAKDLAEKMNTAHFCQLMEYVLSFSNPHRVLDRLWHFEAAKEDKDDALEWINHYIDILEADVAHRLK